MPAILTRMAAGIPGDVTRREIAVLEPNIVGATDISYGSPVKLGSGKIVPLAASDTAAVIYGFMVRPYPTQASDDTGNKAKAGAACDVLRSGYISVDVASGTPARGGQVYVRVVAATGKSVGDIEAAADSTNTVAVTGCTFMGADDDNDVTEIAYNI